MRLSTTAHACITTRKPSATSTLYEPNAVFSQLQGSASMTYFPPFLSLLSLLVLLIFSFLFSSFSFFAFLSFLSAFFVSFLLDVFFCPIGLRLLCVCAVSGTMSNIYVVVFLWCQALWSGFQRASSEMYASIWSWHIVG